MELIPNGGVLKQVLEYERPDGTRWSPCPVCGEAITQWESKAENWVRHAVYAEDAWAAAYGAAVAEVSEPTRDRWTFGPCGHFAYSFRSLSNYKSRAAVSRG